MNMISTGAFLNEMDASNKQPTAAETFAAVWEKKNAKAARAGGVSLMALSLAACGSSSTTTTTTTDTTTTTTTTPAVDAAKEFVLTSAANVGAAFTGGSGADTYFASNSTLTVADAINGGAGTDTLKYTDSSAGGVAPVMTQVSGVEVIEITNQAGTAAVAAVAAVAEQQELVLTGDTTTGANFAFLGVNTAVLTADTMANVATKVVANKANILAGAAATAAGITDVSASGAVLTLTYGGAGGKGDVANLAAASASNGVTAGASNETVKGALAVAEVAATTKAMTVDMTNQTGSTGVVNNGSKGAVTFSAIQNLDTAVTVSNVTAGAAATTTANFKASLITGSADSATLNLSGNTSSGTVTIGAGFETVNVVATGTNTIAALTTGAKTVNITGDGNLTVTATIAGATKIDGSAATGKLALESAVNKVDIDTGSGNDTVTIGIADSDGRELSVNMGAGDDKISFTDMDEESTLLNNKVTIDGGDGVDTFSAEQAMVAELGALSAAAYAKKGITGFEKVEIDDAQADGGAYNVANFGVNHVIVTTDSVNDATYSGLTSGATVELGKSVVDFGGTNGTDDVAITLSDRAGSGDVVNLVTKNTTGAGNFDLALAEVETINITATGSDQANTFDLNAASLTKLTVATKTGDVTVDMTATGNAATALEVVDASGSASTGGVIFAASGSAVKAVTFTGGTGGDTFDGTTLSDTVIAGSGNDNIDVKGGTADTIDITSGGTDTIDITVLTGSMTIKGFTTGDILDFSAAAVDGAEVSYTASLAGAQDITSDATVILGVNASTSSALTAGSQTIADFTDTADVAAYLEEFMNVDDAETFAVVLNDGTNSYAYNLSGSIGTIDAAEVTLLATIENHVVVVADILTT